MEYYPELSAVYVGVSNSKRNHKACADVDNNLIRFRVDLKPTYVTIFHELMHLVQHSDGSPKTEEFCSIYAMSRMPVDLVDTKEIPYIGTYKFSKKEAIALCKDAVKYREKGHRAYIAKLRDGISRKNKEVT